jgi:hypothetical protein
VEWSWSSWGQVMALIALVALNGAAIMDIVTKLVDEREIF